MKQMKELSLVEVALETSEKVFSLRRFLGTPAETVSVHDKQAPASSTSRAYEKIPEFAHVFSSRHEAVPTVFSASTAEPLLW